MDDLYYFQLRPGVFELSDGSANLLWCMSRRNLHSNSGFLSWNYRVVETHNVNASP